MQITAASGSATYVERPIARCLIYVAGGLLLLLLCLPVFSAGPSPVNSDQSLYLAEAVNIADGKGFTYPTGEPVVHRAPLYPAFLAGAFAATGPSLDSAYLVPRLATVSNVLLIAVLGWLLFGGWGGIVAGATAGASAYLRGLGTTLFLDSVQVTFLLASLLVYWRAYSSQNVVLTATAGALLGVSFLIKEASVLFVPLPLIVLLLYGFPIGWKRAMTAWFAGLTITTAWWWLWVFAETEQLFLIGPIDGGLGLGVGFVTLVGAAGLLAVLKLGPPQIKASVRSRLVAGTLVVAWNGLFFVGIDATGWQYDSNYVANVPEYLGKVFLPNVQPAPLVLAAWLWAFWYAARGNTAAGVPVVCLLLYASFFIMVADRGLSLRDQLPIVLLSYLVLGGAAAWLVEAGKSVDLGEPIRSLGGAGGVATGVILAVVIAASGTSVLQAGVTNLQDDWQNPLTVETATWISDNLEPGATIMSSRVYYSQIHFLTNGEYSIHQLPTVEVDLNVDVNAATPLSRRSTLFRWEEHLMPEDSSSDRWLYLARYPVKGYFIALAENDLLLELQRRSVEYLLVSTLDAGFSSPSFNRYFEDNPAFELVHVISATPLDEARIYRVDSSRLASQERAAQVTRSASEYIVRLIGSQEKATEYLRRLNPAGFELTER
jgi:4-amino-4-deoxy-L-arabinose transferase-like glycosyltransferase